MNNPIDIGSMYGLNNNTRNMNTTDTMHSNMYNNYSQTNDFQGYDEMHMNRGMNTSQGRMRSEQNSTNADTQIQNEQYNNSKLAIPAKHQAMQNTGVTANVVVANPYTQVGNNIEFMNDLLRTHIGKMAEVEFLIGNNSTHIRQGQLMGVGTNYIVLKEYNTGRTIIADFYNIKFVTVYDGNY